MSGALDIQVEFDLPPYLRTLNSLGKDQLPYAVAATLTEVALRAQAKVRQQLPRRFNIRNQRVAKGIRIKKANKRDWPNSYALIGTLDDFMVDQELGGIRRARDGRFRAIPSRKVGRKASGGVRAGNRPSRLIGEGKAYFGNRSIQFTGGKTGRGRKGTAYWLREQVRIRPRFGMRETVQQTAAATIQPVFRRQMTAALRSRVAR